MEENENEALDDKIFQMINVLKNQFSGGLPMSEESGSPKSECCHSDGEASDFESGDAADTFNMMMKMKKIMDMNSKQDDPTKNLLYAIKPFLKDSRQERVGHCMKFIGMSKMLKHTDLFKD